MEGVKLDRLERQRLKLLVHHANVLAGTFYRMRGYGQPKVGYRFDRSTHPMEIEAWKLACEAYAFIKHVDVPTAVRVLNETREDANDAQHRA